MRAQLFSSLLALALLSGCAQGPDDPSAQVARWTLDGPRSRVGSLDDPDRTLTQVRDVGVGPDGNLYILQPQDFTVRVFTADGDPVRSIGRQGEGPGELQGPAGLGFLADTLWVRDVRARRVTFYDLDGGFLGDLRFPEVPGLDEAVRASFVTLASGGRALLSTSADFGSDLEGSEHPFPVLSVPRNGGPPDTLATLYTAHDRAMFITGTADNIQSIEILQQVFSDVTLWEVTADGEGIVVADRHRVEGREPTYGMTRVELDGDTIFSIRQPYGPVPIARARIDSIVDRYTRGGRSESEVRGVLYLPDAHPPVSRLLTGTDGSVWVGREAVPDRPVSWDVFSAAGRHVASLELPPGLVPHWTDGRDLWGVETDALDVPYVVRYAVVRDGGP